MALLSHTVINMDTIFHTLKDSFLIAVILLAVVLVCMHLAAYFDSSLLNSLSIFSPKILIFPIIIILAELDVVNILPNSGWFYILIATLGWWVFSFTSLIIVRLIKLRVQSKR